MPVPALLASARVYARRIAEFAVALTEPSRRSKPAAVIEILALLSPTVHDCGHESASPKNR